MGVHVHDYTVQCVLSINLFNEMIYFFIWWWIIIVIVLTIINFMEWAFKLVFTVDRVTYVKKHLKFMNKYDKNDHRKLINGFVFHYLKNDGVFLIRLLAKNTNTLMTSEIVAQLWDNYTEKHRGRMDYTKSPTNQRLHDSSAQSSARSRNNVNGSNNNMYPLNSLAPTSPPEPYNFGVTSANHQITL